MQEKFQDLSPGESESKFIKTWDGEAKEEPVETGSEGKPKRSTAAQCSALVQVSLGP